MLPLPWEIVYMILEHLPPHSSAALALAIKSLFTTLFPTGRVPVLGYYPNQIPSDPSTQFDFSERDELLLLLEKDDPTVAFCFDCRKLCAIDSGLGHLSCAELSVFRWVSFFDRGELWPNPFYRGDAAGSPCVVVGTPPLDLVKYHPLAWIPKMQWPAVNFAEARLTINRHIYGESYGLPLECLEYKYEFERFIDLSTDFIDSHFPLDQHPQGHQYLTRHRQRKVWNSRAINSDVFTHAWTFSHVSKAQIIDSELCIVRFHSIRGPLVERGQFLNLLDSLGLPICRHHNASFPPSLPFLWWPCGYCFTDYSLSIWKDELTGWNCEVATCHRLGSCRSPSDSIWRLATDMGNDFRPSQRRLRMPPDEVKRLEQIVHTSSFMKETPIDQQLELTQTAESNKPGGIEGCWAHLRERLPDWKRWEIRELGWNYVEEDRRSRNSPRSLRNILRRRRGLNTGNT